MKKAFLFLLIALAAVSCQFGDTASELFRGKVVAKVGKHKLYQSQLQDYIPSGVSPEDSTSLAQQYINAWAEDLLLLDMAQEQLSKADKDVSQELEEYRRTLLKYRYEQLYISQRLDTLITEEEIESYYIENKNRFRLELPLLQTRYMIIPAEARGLQALKKKMSSSSEEDIMEADSLAKYAAIKYADASETWMDAVSLARELGVDYRSLMGSLKGSWAEVKDEAGILHTAYVMAVVEEGKPAPMEYVTERIRDLILSARKHKLETDLERNLLEDALQNEKFVIY